MVTVRQKKFLFSVLQGIWEGNSRSGEVVRIAPSYYMLYKRRARKPDRIVFRLLVNACGLLFKTSALLRKSSGLLRSVLRDATEEVMRDASRHVCRVLRDHRLSSVLKLTPRMEKELGMPREGDQNSGLPQFLDVPSWIRNPRTCNWSGSKKKERRLPFDKSNLAARLACTALYSAWARQGASGRDPYFEALVQCCRAVFLMETGRRKYAIYRNFTRKLAGKLGERPLPPGNALFAEGELSLSDHM